MTSWSNFRWAVGIEDTFVPQTLRRDERRLDEFELTQHYRFWKEDFKMAKELGVQMMRYGIPWYRVNPSYGKYYWNWHDGVLDYLVNQVGITPIIDLVHYHPPTWVDNEFLNSSYPKFLAEYAREFASRYGDMIKYYTPSNEPVQCAILCGEMGIWPPYLRGSEGFVNILNSLCKAIILTMNAIREVDPNAVFVHVNAGEIFQTEEEKLKEMARSEFNKRFLMYDLITGRVDKDHILHKWLVNNGMSEYDLEWFRSNPVKLDIVGVNYYPQLDYVDLYTENGETKRRILEGLKGLRTALETHHNRYKRPVFVTETCFFGDAAEKVTWLKESITEIERLRAEGIEVIGYTWWPLYDMVGWDYRFGNKPAESYIGWIRTPEGDRKRGGLWRLEPQFDGTLKRIKTEAASAYAHLISSKRNRSRTEG